RCLWRARELPGRCRWCHSLSPYGLYHCRRCSQGDLAGGGKMALRHISSLALMAILALYLAGAAGSASAAIEVRTFDDPLMEQRFDDLSATLRCPKCENQAIGDSNSPIA